MRQPEPRLKVEPLPISVSAPIAVSAMAGAMLLPFISSISSRLLAVVPLPRFTSVLAMHKGHYRGTIALAYAAS